MDQAYESLSSIATSERVLLLSYCLRPSQSCPAKFEKQGLMCPEHCREDCIVGRLTHAARSLGYSGVCVAAGGAMAVRFVKEHAPRGIVAVACQKELVEGVDAVKRLSGDGNKPPVIVAVPLLKDGCVDTEVDETLAQEAIALGCHTRCRAAGKDNARSGPNGTRAGEH